MAASPFAFKTVDGAKTYPVKNGVANFLASSSWISPDNANLNRLLEIAKKSNFENALAEVFEDSRYVTDSSRAAYLNLLPLDNESEVLEIGASLGQHTKLIAAKAKHVEALEVVPEQALFAQLSCQQSGINNVFVSVGGENCKLPYKADSFDIVILNYVLEWCGMRAELPFRSAQALLLSECQRALKPGGVLFVSTKNRFNLRLLLGAVDDHVAFRFGNALPRWLMALLSKLKPRPPIWGFLYSYGGLRRALLAKGFRRTAAKLALPDARYPLVYSSFEDTELSALRADQRLLGADRLTAFLLKYVPGRVIKWIAPSLVFIAQK